MKSRILNRALAFVLCVSMVISLFTVPSFGISDVGSIASFTQALYDAYESVGDIVASANEAISYFEFPRIDVIDEPAEFESIVNWYNNGGFAGDLVNRMASQSGRYEEFMANVRSGGKFYAVAKADPRYNGIVRLYDQQMKCWIVDSNGNFPYIDNKVWYDWLNETAGTTPAAAPPDGRWVHTSQVRDTKKIKSVNRSDVENIVAYVAGKYPNSQISISKFKFHDVTYYGVRRLEEGAGDRDWIWCSSDGRPVLYADTPQQGAAQDWNYDKIQDITQEQTDEIKDTTNKQTEEIKDIVGGEVNKVIDTVNGTLTVPSVNFDPTLDIDIDSFLKLNIDDVSFNFDDRSYTIDASSTTYNVTNNYYEYEYYTYNIQYTYNNTYITYIGSTAEYQPKEWALYYELPDGRSSADLTEEDVAGLSFQFADVVNYKKSATDTSLRALYHFDGNTEDDSYWSTQGSFAWNSGASITYMESNAFNGTLYLDEKAHEFTITLPSSIGSQDFTLQWRYYQNNATTSEHNENYVSVGGTKLLGWSEQFMYSLGSTKLSTGLSVGTWQELALVRQNGILYFYHNGIRTGSVNLPAVLRDQIVFHFGASSRAYSMLDELRFLNYAVVKSGAAYTPTAVPYDTNSVLILPDGASPIADEYWQWDKSISPAYSWDFTSGTFSPYSVTTTKTAYVTQASPKGTRDDYTFYQHSSSSGWHASGSSFYTTDGFVSVSATSCLPQLWSSSGEDTTYYFGTTGRSLFYLFPSSCKTTFKGQVYTFDFVLVDGSVYSWTVDFSSLAFKNMSTPLSQSKSFGPFSATVSHAYYSQTSCSYALSLSGTFDLVYIDMVPGDKGNTGHKFISAVYSTDEIKPNTAAVQSDIPIHSYLVGGVRPTLPGRGDVWFPVDASRHRITSVQIYNGRAWEEVNARYWTGKRWIPIYAFDLVTLADMWDVGSEDGGDVSPPIVSEESFWNWWQTTWNAFTSKLFLFLTPGSDDDPDSGSGSISDDVLPGEIGTGDGDSGWSVFELLKALKDGTWAIVKGTVKVAFGGVVGIVTTVATIGDFFNAAGDLSDNIEGGYATWEAP